MNNSGPAPLQGKPILAQNTAKRLETMTEFLWFSSVVSIRCQDSIVK